MRIDTKCIYAGGYPAQAFMKRLKLIKAALSLGGLESSYPGSPIQ